MLRVSREDCVYCIQDSKRGRADIERSSVPVSACPFGGRDRNRWQTIITRRAAVNAGPASSAGGRALVLAGYVGEADTA
jgi:hypothetical protein